MAAGGGESLSATFAALSPAARWAWCTADPA
jgi:hypothetical protein